MKPNLQPQAFENWQRSLTRACAIILSILTLTAVRAGPGTIPAELCENWYDQPDITGWFQFSEDADKAITWISNGGFDGTPCVSSELGTLTDFPENPVVYYPLYTYEDNHPVDFAATPLVKLSVNLERGNANLQGGSLRLFVGEWRADNDYAFYCFTRAKFSTTGLGWITSEIELTAAGTDWSRYHAAGINPPALADVLSLPQQWGFAIFDATGQPTGQVYFDEVRVTKKFRWETWDHAGDTNGWYYFGTGELGPPVRWSEAGGVAGSGFAWTPLAELETSAMTGAALFPLVAYGCAKQGALHPLNLRDRNQISVFLNPNPMVQAGNQPLLANLGGGTLSLWIGRWNAPDNYAFYRYARENFDPGTNGWKRSIITVEGNPSDWKWIPELQQPPQGAPSVTELLADPQQWGIGLFGATGPLSGNLGFDLLSARQHAENWNRQHDTNGWFYYAGAEPGVTLQWRPDGGVGNSPFVRCPLDALAIWPVTHLNRYYPLYSVADYHVVNLYEKPNVSVALNFKAEPSQPAELKGDLTVFVGIFVDDNNYAFYFFKHYFPYRVDWGSIGANHDWFRTGLQLTDNLEDWDIVDSQPSPPGSTTDQPGRVKFPLVELLKQPAQWGIAIVNVPGDARPAGFLGFDDLLLSPFQPRLTIQRLAGGWVTVNVEGTYDEDEVFILWEFPEPVTFGMITSDAGITFRPTEPMRFFRAER